MSRGPSRRHELAAWLVPRLGGSDDAGSDDEAVERERVVRCHAERSRDLPTRATPGLSRRFRVAEERVDAPGGRFASWVLTPCWTTPVRTLYYLHGGGFVSPLDVLHVRYATTLARALEARVVLPDYPLAPEHTWRDSHDALADDVVRYARRGPVALAGDSAGGNLALSVAQTLRDRGGSQPHRLLLLSPWVDLSESTPRTAELQDDDPMLRLPALRRYAGWWAGSTDPDALARPEVSPALGDLDDLPPALMFCGTRDLLQPACRMLADEAEQSDWSLTYVEQPGLVHVYPLLPGVPEAREARRRAVAFLR